MRKLFLAAFLLLPALTFADSIQVGSMTYMGSGRFDVNFTNALLVFNFEAMDWIDGSARSAPLSTHSFQAGTGLPFCPCQWAGFTLITPTGHNYPLTLPNIGNRLILAHSNSFMLGPFQVGDTRSVNITTVPEPSSLALVGTGLLGLWRFRKAI